MTNMELAMKEAGLKIPRLKRVWMAIKDHPNSTGQEIAFKINMSKGEVGRLLWELENRGMIKSTVTLKRVRRGKIFAEFPIKSYSVGIREYELLPKKPVHKPVHKPPEPRNGDGPRHEATHLPLPPVLPPPSNISLSEVVLDLADAVARAGGQPRIVLNPTVLKFVESMYKNGNVVCIK